MGREREPWNINIHYDALLVALARPGDRVLDVGCGDGFLSAALEDLGCRVTAIDADAGVVGRARERWRDRGIEWIHGDVLGYPVEAGGYDVVVSNATLHHLPDAEQALLRLREFVRPGGRLGVVGFARSELRDWPRTLLGGVASATLDRVRHKWEHAAPIVWPPTDAYRHVRNTSARVLLGSEFRKLWLGRYLLR